MKAQDIVNQLAAILPSLVDDFTDNIGVIKITQLGTTVSVNTSVVHGLAVGQAVNITGVFRSIKINSLTRIGIEGTLVTVEDHDMTENADFSVVIQDAGEPEFNGTFVLLKVKNRRTVTFLMADSGPTNGISGFLLSGSSPLQTYNGLQEVTFITNSMNFDYELTNSVVFDTGDGVVVVKKSPRISAAVDIERVFDAYTKQEPFKAWLFVVLGDAVANKNKNIDLDGVNNLQRGQFFDQRVIQGVSIYLFLPTSDEILGRMARDRAQELFSPICRSILMGKFDTQLAESIQNPLQLTGHGFQAYNTAFYVHRYDFEALEQLTQGDIFEPTDDVAFRDISMTNKLDIGTLVETINTEIDLDEEILP